MAEPSHADASSVTGAAAVARPPRVHPLVWILVGGAIVRGLLLLWFAGQPLRICDEREYNELAVHLVQQGEYVLDGQTSSMRPPLYPACVAALYTVCGTENYQAVRVVQAGIALATVLLVYLLGRELYDRRVGLWLSETLFTFWLVAICLAVIRSMRQTSLGWLLAAGVLIGLAALTRSVLWLFPPLLAVYLLAAWPAAFRRRLLGAGLMIAASCATIAPWSIRCTRLEQTFVAIDVMGGRNLMMGNYEHTPLERMWDVINTPDDPKAEAKPWYRVLAGENPGFAQLTQGQRDKLAMRYGLGYMLAHPGQTAVRTVVRFFNFWQLERSLVAGMSQGWFGNLPLPAILALTAVVFSTYAAAMLAGIFAAVTWPPADWRKQLLLLLVIVHVCGVHMLVFAHSRYHLPLVPLVLVFSAAGLVHWRQIWAGRRTRRFRIAAALCLVLIGGWVWEIVAVDFQRFVKIFKP